MQLTQQHLQHYFEHGYVVVEGALTNDDLQPVIDDYTTIVDEVAHELHGQSLIDGLFEDEPFEKRLARIADEHEETYHADDRFDIGATRRRGTFEFLRNSHLLDAVEGFVGPEIACNSITHVRAKLPSDEARKRNSNVAGWHQDAVFTTTEAHHILQVTVWLPLCDATEENGCLQIRPGMHQQRTVYWSSHDLPEIEPVLVPMQKGDVIFIHKLCPHGSGPNRTDGVRWSMDIRYQKNSEPSPRPEWPSLVARSRQDPASETEYEDWRDRWAAALQAHPSKLGRERPSGVQPYTGEMYLEGPVT